MHLYGICTISPQQLSVKILKLDNQTFGVQQNWKTKQGFSTKKALVMELLLHCVFCWIVLGPFEKTIYQGYYIDGLTTTDIGTLRLLKAWESIPKP